jgi:hypothetical protein
MLLLLHARELEQGGAKIFHQDAGIGVGQGDVDMMMMKCFIQRKSQVWHNVFAKLGILR